MKLNKTLAKKIVTNTMNVLGKNINIMDDEGIIIGSGDKKRLGHYHEIAAQVVASGKSQVIKKDDASKYKGVKSGINLPIIFNENIIGVVGITGDTDEVSGYGQIVKNMVELILQQEFLLKEIELENKAKETFYQQLLSNSIKDRELLRDRLRLFKIKKSLPRVIYVIKTETTDNRVITQEVQQIYNQTYINNEDDFFLVRGENIVLIKSLTIREMQADEVLKIASKIKNYLKKNVSRVTLGIGHTFTEIDEMHQSYKWAKHALYIGNKIYRDKDSELFYLNHLGFDFFLPHIDQSAVDYYIHKLSDRNIVNIFKETNTGPIIEALVQNNLNISKTAAELFVHRNTLLYRLKKIKEMTGFDPKEIKSLFTLLFAYHLYLFVDGK